MKCPPLQQKDDIFPFHIIMILLVFFHHHTSHIETHRHFDKFTPSFRLSKTFQMFFPHYGKVRTEMRPRPDSHYIRTDFKTGYDVLGDTSLVLSVKYPPAKAVPYLKGLSIYFFHNIYLYIKYLSIYEIIRYEIIRKIFH